MCKFIRKKTLLAWIACLAILFSALAPSISHALAAASGASEMVGICTADGVKTVSVTKADLEKPLGALGAHAFEHCPYCMTDAGSFALLPPLTAGFAVLAFDDVFPPLFYHAPRPLFSWTAANPRAPPAI